MNIDNVRPDSLYFLEGQAQPRDSVGADVVNEDIALFDQLAHGRLARLGLHVPDNRPLAAIDGHMARAHAARIGGLANIAERIACFRLQLDHVGAHIGERLRAIGTEDDGRHVSDPDVRKKRCSRHGSLLAPYSARTGSFVNPRPHPSVGAHMCRRQ